MHVTYPSITIGVFNHSLSNPSVIDLEHKLGKSAVGVPHQAVLLGPIEAEDLKDFVMVLLSIEPAFIRYTLDVDLAIFESVCIVLFTTPFDALGS